MIHAGREEASVDLYRGGEMEIVRAQISDVYNGSDKPRLFLFDIVVDWWVSV